MCQNTSNNIRSRSSVKRAAGRTKKRKQVDHIAHAEYGAWTTGRSGIWVRLGRGKDELQCPCVSRAEALWSRVQKRHEASIAFSRLPVTDGMLSEAVVLQGGGWLTERLHSKFYTLIRVMLVNIKHCRQFDFSVLLFGYVNIATIDCPQDKLTNVFPSCRYFLRINNISCIALYVVSMEGTVCHMKSNCSSSNYRKYADQKLNIRACKVPITFTFFRVISGRLEVMLQFSDYLWNFAPKSFRPCFVFCFSRAKHSVESLFPNYDRSRVQSRSGFFLFRYIRRSYEQVI
jgi:hypothetical protein